MQNSSPSISHAPSPTPSPRRRTPTLGGDLTAAYGAAALRVGAWATVSALVYRLAGPAEFATLALIRGTIGILNYTAVGLAPALVRLLSAAQQRTSAEEEVPLPDEANEASLTAPMPVPVQQTRLPIRHENERTIYVTGLIVAAASAVVGALITVIYALLFRRLHFVPPLLAAKAPWAVVFIGLGVLLRLFSDAPGALLQTRGRIALDNRLLGGADAIWALLALCLFPFAGLLTASITYSLAGAALAAGRLWQVYRLPQSPWPPVVRRIRPDIAKQLLSFGALVLLAQLAEYFYAPTDYILINHFFSANEVAAYAPGVQLDMALLMLVTALAAVLLPRTALAHFAGDGASVRRYYLRGTAASTLLLCLGAAGVWLLYPFIFRLWFGKHPPDTRSILDLVLLGTIIGGSSAVGRSVLIGIGQVRAFTIAAIAAGLVNVIASYCFVRYGHLGLRGILYGTVVAVAARCGLWMPWYVMRKLGRANPGAQDNS